MQAITNFLALYNDNTKKILEQATQENKEKENLNSLIDLFTIAIAAEDGNSAEDEPQQISKAWNHPNMKY